MCLLPLCLLFANKKVWRPIKGLIWEKLASGFYNSEYLANQEWIQNTWILKILENSLHCLAISSDISAFKNKPCPILFSW